MYKRFSFASLPLPCFRFLRKRIICLHKRTSMGLRQSTDCCDWSLTEKAIYLSGDFIQLDQHRICFPLSERQKSDLKNFFEQEYQCITDFRQGLVVHLPEGTPPPIPYEKIMVKFLCIRGLAIFHLLPIDIAEEIRTKINSH